MLQQGVTAHNAGNLQEAGRLYRAILQSQPTHPDANHNLGLIAVSMNQSAVALPLFKLALEANPKIEQFWLSYIDALIKDNQIKDAKRAIKKAKKKGFDGEKLEALWLQSIAPADVTSLSRNLLEHFQNGRYGDAEKLAISLTQEFPKHPFGWKVLGAVLKQTNRISESLVPSQKAVEITPQDAEAHNNLGITLKELGRLEESEASYRQAIALKPDFAEAHNNLGNMLQELGKLEESEASYRQAIVLKSDYAEAFYNLGNTLQDLAKLEEAEASYRQAISMKPDFADVYNNLGVTLKEIGRFEEAEEKFRQAIALKADYGDAHYLLGVLLFENRQYDMAAEQFGLADIRQSKSYAMRCSYLQDEETVFYEKLKALIDQGERDAVIGSLSCSAEIRYGVRKPNPFCNDPLEYVVKTDLSERYDFENIFTKTARDILTDKSVSYKAQGHLTNGIQTAGNFFALEKVVITEIESIIRAEIEKYRINFKDSEEGFIKHWPTSYDIYGWLVCMQSGGELAAHMHDNGWITGGVYINVPPKSKSDSGNLVLCVGDQKNVLGADKSQESSIDVVTGSLCFFPSSLHHYTVPFEEKENRIMLAFDVVPKK